MEKLFRFFVVFIMYILMFLIMYITIPSIVWLFGGSFLEVAQHPAHVVLIGLSSLITSGVIIGECFDENFRSKH